MDPTPRRPSSPDDIDISALLRAIADRKKWLATITIGAGLLTFIALSFVTPYYSSEARLLIDYEESAYTRPTSEQGGSELRAELDQQTVASQVEVLLSKDLALRVVEGLNLKRNPEFNSATGIGDMLRQFMRSVGLVPEASDAALQERVLDAFMERLDVYQLKDSRVIAIVFQSEDPQTAANVANRLAEVYLDWQQQEKLKQTREATKWLSAQIEELTKRVEEADMKVEKFRKSSGLIAGSNNVTLDAQQLSELNTQLIQARAQRTEAEARAELIKKMLEEKGDVAAAADVLNSRLIQRLLEQRVRLQRQLAELSASLLPSHPRINELKSEIADLRSQIREEARKVVASLQNEAQIAGAREQSLHKSLAEMKEEAATANERQVKLRALEREAKATREILESYLSRYRDASARRDESSIPAHASIISRAYVSNVPSFPKKIPISLLVSVAAGLLGFAYVVAQELIHGQQAGASAQPSYVAHTAGLGTIGYSGDESGKLKSSDAAQPPLPYTEARSPRELARRFARGSGEHTKRIFIAPDSSDAKVAHEAVLTARGIMTGGNRVIIVDVAGGNDSVSAVTGVPDTPGLAQLLRRQAQFEDVIHLEQRSGLHVIAAGAVRDIPIEPRSLEALQRTIQALEAAYDYVVIHAGAKQIQPLLPAMNESDAALVLIATDLKGKDAAARFAQSLLEKAGALSELVLMRPQNGLRKKLAMLPSLNRAAA